MTGYNIVPTAIYSIRKTQHQMQKDQNDLLVMAKNMQDQHPDFAFDNLYKIVKERIEHELRASTNLDEALQNHKEFEKFVLRLREFVRDLNTGEKCIEDFTKTFEGEENTSGKKILDRIMHSYKGGQYKKIISFLDFFDEQQTSSIQAIKNNDLFKILSCVDEMATEENISSILNGVLPNGFDNSIKKGEFLELGKLDNYWGTSKPTIVSAFSYLVCCVVKGMGCVNVDNSSIFHNFKMPTTISVDDISDSMYINGDQRYLTLPHSGFAYGGDTASEKSFRPEYSASFLDTQYKVPQLTTRSVNLYAIYFSLSKGDSVIPNSWANNKNKGLVKLFDLTDSPKAGDLFVSRNFTEKSPIEHSLGSSGHAGIYLGTNDSGMAVTLSCNMNFPNIEGFGLELRNMSSSEKKKCFFLSPSKNLLSRLDIEEVNYPEYDSLDDLVPVTSFFDDLIEQNRLLGESGISNLLDDQ